VGSPKTTGFGDCRWLARFRGTLRGRLPVLHCPPFALQALKRLTGRAHAGKGFRPALRPTLRSARQRVSLRAGVGGADCGPSEQRIGVAAPRPRGGSRAVVADKDGSSVQPNRHTGKSAPESTLRAPPTKLVVVQLWWLEKAPLRACARLTCKSLLFIVAGPGFEPGAP
jgi:hypothetical protein